MPFSKKELSYRLVDETGTRYQYDYLTVTCNTRSKTTATRAKNLINSGQYAKALKLADPIAYTVGLREHTR